MQSTLSYTEPQAFFAIKNATALAGFQMPSETEVGALLRTLAATKQGGKMLELGTGTGLSTSWLLDGMDENATLTSVDHDQQLLDIARENLGNDARLDLVCADCGEWLSENAAARFDLIFADTWHGKYLVTDEALALLNPGGLYIIDDMLPQENWPEGHSEKADALIAELYNKAGFTLVNLRWSSGVIIMTRRKESQYSYLNTKI
ncbi:MAG: class I SAM-dependent methyltransferase [Mucilaginibacter polytrichastri]|nr:class I SAM-dependent methyltransferase [Mucilaginibacter polytrichastri]